jgi:hypothetical protein
VALITGLVIIVLVGFAGLALDLGRFFVIKSELQNAVDACALAAGAQLRPGQGDASVLARARAYGQLAASRNGVNFQSESIAIRDEQITFSDKMDFSTNADGNTARYVKCAYPLSGLPVYFMRVLNPELAEQTISAMAVAGLSATSTACAIPTGLCMGSGPNYGLTPGEWLRAKSGSSLGKGFFGWIDFTQQGGGRSELVATLKGSGQCDLSAVTSVTAAYLSPGNKTSVDAAWNSRFGWYDKLTPLEAPPDYTGRAYSQDTNWPAGANAMADYANARAAHYSYQGGVPADIENAPGYQKYVALPLNASNTSSRRVVSAPVIDCSDLSKNVPVQTWACVLMLNPMISAGNPKPPFVWDTAAVEFLGISGASDDACAQWTPVVAQ